MENGLVYILKGIILSVSNVELNTPSHMQPRTSVERLRKEESNYIDLTNEKYHLIELKRVPLRIPILTPS